MNDSKGFICYALDKSLEIVRRLNAENRHAFEIVDYGDRALFMPQCMRNADKCVAEETEMGYVCKHCGQCDIAEISLYAEELGYRVFIVPGGSMVYRIMSTVRSKAVMGIACAFELAEAMEKISNFKIPCMGVLLDKDGCINTRVNIGTVMDTLRFSNVLEIGKKVKLFP